MSYPIKLMAGMPLLFSIFITGCGGSHSLPSPVYAAVPATACGVATVAATATSSDVRFIDPVNVSDAGGLSEHPAVAAGSNGKVYVAWDDDKEQKKDIFFRWSEDYGSTYQPAAQSAVNVSNTGNATVPAMAVGNTGIVHIAWQDVSRGPSEIFYARSVNADGVFSSASQVSMANAVGDNATQAQGVSLAVAPSTASAGAGNIYLAWAESNLTPNQSNAFTLKIARSTDRGVNFSLVQTYVPAASDVSPVNPALAVDTDGNLHVSWSESTRSGTTRTIQYAKSTDAGESFATPIQLDSGPTLSSPSIAVDGNSGVYIAWRNEPDPDHATIGFAVSINKGDNFSNPTSILVGSKKSISARLATGPGGTIYLSWTDNRGGNYDTYFSKSINQGNKFTEPVNFAPSAQGSLFTAIAVDDESNVYIAWDDNRYPNPPDTPEEVGNEGNFEILLARGKQDLPAVQAGLASPCPVTPNGDGNTDMTTITATFSEVLNWTLNIFAVDGSSVFQQAGSGASMVTVWDGRINGSSSVAADGLYTYSIAGFNSSDVASTTATGSLNLYTTAADAAPAIVVTTSGVVQTSTFQREAFAFSPNGDGFKDSDGISAQFNKPVNWTVQIKDSSGAVKRTLTGSGLNIDSDATRWDGKDDAGNPLPEGNYIVSLSIMDGQGRSASCGQLPVACLNMEIDTTVPDVSGAGVSPTTYNPPGELTISGTPTETALITIYVYNQVGVLVRKANREFRDAGTLFSVPWDGKDSNAQTVTPGSYEVYMWCRDRAGNTAATYPIKIAFTVQ
ncbi:MAG: gliding motility-associated C-terminal domain-containing protein [Gallionellaceae bacterium]|nr:gliding motility-associated C-terminal domain-containing protein [Gallionellaceae bacterium]